jgi:hypothetical protein
MAFTASIGLRIAQITLPMQMLLSHRLWWPGPDRTFPLVGLGEWPHALHGCLSTYEAGVFVAAAAGWLTPQRWAWLSLLGWTAAALGDVNRLQPWVWMWILLAFGHLSTRNSHAALWLLPAIYAWSGCHKFSPWAADVFADFYRVFAWTRPLAQWPVAAYLPAFVECCIALLLLRKSSRKWGVIFATILHLYIVLLLSPAGLDWNVVVIPWNIAMIALVWGFVAMPTFELQTTQHKLTFGAIMGLAAFGPALNFVGFWPETFSWKMYSNTQPEATLVYKKGGPPCTNMAAIWTKKSSSDRYLLLDDWAIDNLGTPPFNHLKLYQAVARQVRNCADEPSMVELHWLEVLPWKKTSAEPVPVNF